jgi:hypothetical protein
MNLFAGSLSFYDYIAFAVLILLLVAAFALVLFIMGLPGRIALQRNHPHAEAVKVMGWLGFLAVVPWVNAFSWAFHGVTVDIRRYPDEEREAIRRELAAKREQKPEPTVGETPSKN